jgi:hypothetical protein
MPNAVPSPAAVFVMLSDGTILHVGDDLHEGKNNNSATVAPTVTDDVNSGYGVGSRWNDVTADALYFCLDASAGAAVWTGDLAQGGGGGEDDILYAENETEASGTGNGFPSQGSADSNNRNHLNVMTPALTGDHYVFWYAEIANELADKPTLSRCYNDTTGVELGRSGWHASDLEILTNGEDAYVSYAGFEKVTFTGAAEKLRIQIGRIASFGGSWYIRKARLRIRTAGA